METGSKRRRRRKRGVGENKPGDFSWRCCWWRWQRFLLCLFAFLLLPVYVLPLLCFFFYFCRWWCCGGRGWWRCGGCSSSLLCFSLFLLPLCSVRFLSSVLSLYSPMFFFLFLGHSKNSPPSHLISLPWYLQGGKKGREGYYPCPVVAQG